MDGAAGRSMVLRAFAKGRSYAELTVGEAQNASLFGTLSRWLAGSIEPETLTATEQKRLWAHGLMISDAELRITSHRQPGIGQGLDHALALYPEIAGLAARGIAVDDSCIEPVPSFASRGFSELPPLLHPQDAEAVTRYYVGLARAGWLIVERDEVKRHVIRNDAIGRMLLTACAPIVSTITGRKVVPTYSFASYYLEGSGLLQHFDRQGRTYTLGLFLAYEPASAMTDGISPWPFRVHPAEGEVTIWPKLRGGVLFSGRELAHSRPLLPEGHRCLNLLLHYAPA